jgi:hypothetical protein
MWWLVQCDGSRGGLIAGAILWAGVAQRVWPRLKQSLAIFASNYQIVSSLPFALDVDVPSPFAEVLSAIGGFVDGAADEIPSVACTLGGSFRNRLIFKACCPIVLLALCQVVHGLRVWHLAARRMPIRGAVPKPWRIKVARALIRSELRQSKATWDFAIIYLLYPVDRVDRVDCVDL